MAMISQLEQNMKHAALLANSVKIKWPLRYDV